MPLGGEPPWSQSEGGHRTEAPAALVQGLFRAWIIEAPAARTQGLFSRRTSETTATRVWGPRLL